MIMNLIVYGLLLSCLLGLLVLVAALLWQRLYLALLCFFFIQFGLLGVFCMGVLRLAERVLGCSQIMLC